MGIGCESRTVPAAVCSCFPLRGANVCDTLLPLTSGSGRRRRRNESEDLPLRLNFVLPFLASAIRANSIALGLTKWFVFLQSFSRLGIARILFASALGSGKTSVFDRRSPVSGPIRGGPVRPDEDGVRTKIRLSRVPCKFICMAEAKYLRRSQRYE